MHLKCNAVVLNWVTSSVQSPKDDHTGGWLKHTTSYITDNFIYKDFACA